MTQNELFLTMAAITIFLSVQVYLIRRRNFIRFRRSLKPGDLVRFKTDKGRHNGEILEIKGESVRVKTTSGKMIWIMRNYLKPDF